MPRVIVLGLVVVEVVADGLDGRVAGHLGVVLAEVFGSRKSGEVRLGLEVIACG